MGNETQKYHGAIEEYKREPPVIFPKGRVYEKLLSNKLNGKYYLADAYWRVYDLRNKKESWRLSIYVKGRELSFSLSTLKHISIDKLSEDVAYSLTISKYSEYELVLTGSRVRLDLYLDNIHHHILNGDGSDILGREANAYGFIEIDNTGKMPIIF